MFITPETRMQAALDLLGWKGGTVHQVCAELGVSVEQLLYAEPPSYVIGGQHYLGNLAYARHGAETALRMIKNEGNLDFVLGVLRGVADKKFL